MIADLKFEIKDWELIMRWMWLVLLAATVVAAAETPEDKEKDALKKLAGVWRVETATLDGMDLAKAIGEEIVFEGNKVTKRHPQGGEEEVFTCKINPQATPLEMDLKPEDKDKVDILRCIYEIKGETLKICVQRRDQDRPREFKDDGCALVTLKKL